VHLLEYSYENSREKFVTHKENSLGRLKKYILHYSFSAIYERKKEEAPATKMMKYGKGIEEEEQNESEPSQFGIVISGP
jgi:hypothetical protein